MTERTRTVERMSDQDTRATIIGRIETAFGGGADPAEVREKAEWVVNGYPWPASPESPQRAHLRELTQRSQEYEGGYK